jgi:thymidylate synthase
MNNLDRQYQALLNDILDNGVKKEDRTGTGTISVFGRQIRHKMSEGFPLLTTKKMPFKTIVTELLWFLNGDTNIKYLVDNNCNIWNGDAYKNYEKWWDNMSKTSPFEVPKKFTEKELVQAIKLDEFHEKTFGELGPIYGKQWRQWNTSKSVVVGHNGNHNEFGTIVIDQIQNLINDLKTNPDSRRLMVNAWNVGELDQMVLPPCHYGFQVYTRELSLEERAKLWNNTHNPTGNIYTHNQYDENEIPARAISLMWNQRSVDTFLGLPFNIASYGLLLEILAKTVNMVPDELIGNLGDVHLYSNHLEQAKEQIGRELKFPERTEMLKNKMGEEQYNKAVDELMPFGGGMSEYFETYKIPYRTCEPYPLPSIQHMNSDAYYESLSNSISLMGHMKKDDFILNNYQSHSEIKAPLSN